MITKSIASDRLTSRPSPPARRVAVPTVRRTVKLFGATVVASALMSFVPAVNVGTVIFVATLLVYFLDWILTGRITVSGTRSLPALAFLVICLASYVVVTSNGYGFAEWGRAVVPFLFYFLIFTVPELNERERPWLGRALFVACMVWAVRIVGEAVFLRIAEGSDVFSVRLTFRVIDSVIPFPLVVIPYLLFVEKPLSTAVRYSLLAALLGLYLWIGYRAGLALLVIPFLLFTWQRAKNRSVLPIIGVMIAASIGWYAVTNNVFSLADRFSTVTTEETDSSRALEWRYAYDQFLDSPIYGQGLGWQVPGYITFAGVDDPEADKAERVGYVHSSLAYMMMNLGVIGVIFYFSLLMPRPYKRTDDELFRFASVALLMLMLFCLTQASFRIIQVVVLTVALLKLNVRPSHIQLRARRRR